MSFTPHEILIGFSNREKMGGGGGGHLARMEGELHTGFWWGNLREITTWKTQA